MRTRTRQEGTIEYHTETLDDKIKAFRAIVQDCTYAKIDGICIDITTAHMVTSVFDHLNNENKQKYLSLSIKKMSLLAWELAGK